MSNGSTNANPSNIELTPMRVTWGGTDLGSTTGNVVVSVKTGKAPIKADQYGTTILDERTNGQAITVTTEILETRDIAHWADVFPGATFTAGLNGALTFQLPIGRSDRDNAALLNLHPLVKADNDTSQDHNFYLAHPNEQSQITYGPGGQSNLKLIFNCFPVLTGSGAPKFYKYGTIGAGP